MSKPQATKEPQTAKTAPKLDEPFKRVLRLDHAVHPPWLASPVQSFVEGQDGVQTVEWVDGGFRVTWANGRILVRLAGGALFG